MQAQKTAGQIASTANVRSTGSCDASEPAAEIRRGDRADLAHPRRPARAERTMRRRIERAGDAEHAVVAAAEEQHEARHQHDERRRAHVAEADDQQEAAPAIAGISARLTAPMRSINRMRSRPPIAPHSELRDVP